MTNLFTRSFITLVFLIAVSASHCHAADPVITSPVPQTLLPSSTATFTWESGGHSSLWFKVGLHPTSDEYYSAQHGDTSATVTTIPTDGTPVYATLYYWDGTEYQIGDIASYKASGSGGVTDAVLTSPANNTIFSLSTVDFEWSAGSYTTFALQGYSYDETTSDYTTPLFNETVSLTTTFTATNLPTDGTKVMVKLYIWDGIMWLLTDQFYYNPPQTLMVQMMGGSDPGTVDSDPAGINCGTEGASCWNSFKASSAVVLNAVPKPGYTFTSWSGACFGFGSDDCILSMDSDKTAIAIFTANTLNVTVSGGKNSGTISSDIGGINCGTECSAIYDIDATVTLTAVPEPDYIFAGWSWPCSGTADCVLTMDSSKTVSASFVIANSIEWQKIEGQGPTHSVNSIWGTGSDKVYATSDTFFQNDMGCWTKTTAAGGYAIWGTSDSDIYQAGYGTISHFDGTVWTESSQLSNYVINAIWGSGSSDIFAVGAAGAIFHYDGSSWSSITSNTTATLHSVWGNGPNDIFTVGQLGTILHYDGNSWSTMFSGTSADLMGIWGSGPSDIFAVGNAGTILHYDGNTWTSIMTSVGNTQTLTSIWGSGADDIFVGSENGEILHFDGTYWGTFGQINIGGITSIWGTGPENVYAAGAYGVSHYSSQRPSFLLVETRQPALSYSVVSSGDNQIDCGDNCCQVYPSATLVSLTATPDTGAIFDGWGGECNGTDGCNVSIEGQTLVSAFFSKESKEILSIDWVGSQLPSQINAIWGISAEDIYAVGAVGMIHHFDGTQWSVMPSAPTTLLPGGTTRNLTDIWGSSSEDIFAVGASGAILHYDGNSWSAMDSGPTTLSFNAIWGSGPDDVFAIDFYGTIIHYDGSTWSTMASGLSTYLYDIWGSGPDNVYAVGYQGNLLHYDGNSWSVMDSGSTALLQAIWGSGPNDIFAVGNNGTILHYDGSSWSAMTSGAIGTFTNVWGNASNNVYAIDTQGILLHYNGAAWAPVDLATDFDLRAVSALWGDNLGILYLGGRNIQTSRGFLLHYDGTNSIFPEDIPVPVLDIIGFNPNALFTVGLNGVLFYDGTSWSLMDTGGTGGNDIWGSSPNDVFVVGNSGSILHYDGSTWAPMNSGTTQSLNCIWGNGSDDIFAAGFSGTLLHYDGSTWSTMSSGTSRHLYGIWGSGSDNVFTVGAYGTLLHYDGSIWSVIDSGTTQSLNSIWGSGSDNIYAVGGTILHYDGSNWSDISDGRTYSFQNIWGDNAESIFITDSYSLRYFNGSTWEIISPSPSITDMWGIDGAYFAVGSGFVKLSKLQATLTLLKAGSGQGIATSVPAGINCGSTCTYYDFREDSLLTITATSEDNSFIKGWSDTTCGNNPSCAIYMDEDKHLTVTFGLKGDLNNDDSVDLFDLILALQIISGRNTSAYLPADTNGNSHVDMADAIYTLQFLGKE